MLPEGIDASPVPVIFNGSIKQGVKALFERRKRDKWGILAGASRIARQSPGGMIFTYSIAELPGIVFSTISPTVHLSYLMHVANLTT